MTVSFKCNI